jgi:hypothetical protein
MTKRKDKKKKKGDFPVSPKAESKGTPVLGVVYLPYVQTDVPVKYSGDVCNALAKVILADYHRSFCPPNGRDDDT